MDKRFKLFLLLRILPALFLTGGLHAQVTQEWVARYNGPEADYSSAIAADINGNVTVAGWTAESVFGYSDILTLRYSANGSLLWRATYQGGPFFNEAAVVGSDDLGNVYVAGSIYNATVPDGALIVKYNAQGVLVWSEEYGGWRSSICDMAVDNSGNVVTIGSGIGPGFYYDYLILKYDSSGNVMWSAMFDGEENDFARDLSVDDSGNIIITGNAYRIAQHATDIGTVKFSPSGIQQWVAFHNGPGDSTDYGVSVDNDESGNIYVAGVCMGLNNEQLMTTIKYDRNGQLLWAVEYPGACHPVQINTAGANSVYVSGTIEDSSGSDYLTVKYDSAGNLLWTFTYNGTGNSDDEISAMRIDTEGSVYLTGTCINAVTGKDFVTLKLDSSGEMKWCMACSGTEPDDVATCLDVDKNGSVYVSGNIQGNGGDIMTVKYSQMTGIEELQSSDITGYVLHQNFPNPFNPVSTINYDLPDDGFVTIKVYDILGREVKTLVNEMKTAGYHKVQFNAADLASGAYLYRLSVSGNEKEFVAVRKCVVVK